MRERTQTLQSRLDERAEDEVGKMRAILGELRRSIRELLDGPEPVQLELCTPPEREQLERDRGALRARLDEIPAEIEREERALRARYADPRPHLFPVAVTFLVPMKFDR